MLVPKLRFNSYTENWKETQLKDISKINKNTVSKLPDKFIYIDLESVNKGVLEKENIINSKDAPSRARRKVELNNILFQTVRPYQSNNYYVENIKELTYIASTGYAVFSDYKINSYFLYNYLHTTKFINNVLNCCTGTSYPAINSNDLSELTIKYPINIEEQEKISKLFMYLNKKIELQQKKIEALKMYKKGLANKIYNTLIDQNIELKHYAFIQSGFAFKSELFQKTGKPIIRIANIENNIVNLNELVYYNDNIKIDNKFYINTNDLLIAMSGATAGKYGIYTNTNTAYLNQRVGKIVNRNIDTLYYPYLYFLFQLDEYERQLQSKLVAGAQPNISPADIETMKFKFPSIAIQKNIANIIINITNKIIIEKKKLDNLNNIKQSLLQQMFI